LLGVIPWWGRAWFLSDATYRFLRNIPEVVLRIIHTVLETAACAVHVLLDCRKRALRIRPELAEGPDGKASLVLTKAVTTAVAKVKITQQSRHSYVRAAVDLPKCYSGTLSAPHVFAEQYLDEMGHRCLGLRSD
jgi:hypothetical protein